MSVGLSTVYSGDHIFIRDGSGVFVLTVMSHNTQLSVVLLSLIKPYRVT